MHKVVTRSTVPKTGSGSVDWFEGRQHEVHVVVARWRCYIVAGEAVRDAGKEDLLGAFDRGATQGTEIDTGRTGSAADHVTTGAEGSVQRTIGTDLAGEDFA